MKVLKRINKILRYIFSPKKYYESIELCDEYSSYLAVYIKERLPKQYRENKRIASFSSYSSVDVFRVNRSKYKLFYTGENTHLDTSRWQQWEDCHLWKHAPTLSVGFDYCEHPKYIRFPYWLTHIFKINVTKEKVKDFVAQYNYSDSTNRRKDCAFVCRKDYFGDRAQIADIVEQVMPINYPSDFRHNDDDMRGKYNNDKVNYLHDVRFNLCPENSNNKGYVTEKIFEAIKAGCVPIYWGNDGYPEPDILNPKAIVYLDKDKPEDGLALLKKLYEDPKAYEEFASQPRFLPGAADKIYAYYERLETKIMEILQ